MYLFKYILKRLGLMLFTFLVIITMCFVLVKLLPNSFEPKPGQDVQLILIRREMLGYDKPIIEQYFRFWFYALQGQFGASEILYPNQDVWPIFTSKLPFTMVLNLCSIILSIPVGLGLGIFAALKKILDFRADLYEQKKEDTEK